MKTSTDAIANYLIVVRPENSPLSWTDACFLTSQLFPSQNCVWTFHSFWGGSRCPLSGSLFSVVEVPLWNRQFGLAAASHEAVGFQILAFLFPMETDKERQTVCVPRVLEQMQVDTTQKQKAWPVFFCSPNETTSLFVEWFLQSPSAFIMQSMTLTWTSHICPAGNSDFRYWSDSSITTKQKLLWWEGVIGEQLCICISYTHRSHTVLANLCQVDIGCSQLRKCLHQVGLVAKLWRHFLD